MPVLMSHSLLLRVYLIVTANPFAAGSSIVFMCCTDSIVVSVRLLPIKQLPVQRETSHKM